MKDPTESERKCYVRDPEAAKQYMPKSKNAIRSVMTLLIPRIRITFTVVGVDIGYYLTTA